MTPGPALRLAGFAIGILGAIDPAVTSSVRARPIVAVVEPLAGAAADRALADDVARALDGPFVVARGLAPDAAAVVSVGDQLPAAFASIAQPVFAVSAAPAGPAIAIERLEAPRRAPLDSRVRVIVRVHVTNARGRQLEVELAAGGLGVDRATRAIDADDVRVDVPLSLAPSTEGLTPVRATVEIVPRDDARAVADTVIDVDRTVWPVLAFDRRPSWMATFVRRALEDDARFAVTHRTITSTTAATATPGAPLTLADAAALARFDAIVVGAPESLTPADVVGLETYLRRRGGAVVLVFDMRPTAASAIDRLAGVDRWREETSAAPVALRLRDAAPERMDGTDAMRAAELIWPERLPPGAEPIATRQSVATGARESEHAPIVWQAPVGAGRLLVSGALDAWRSRARPDTSFDGFWRQRVATAAAASPPPIEVSFNRAVVGRDERAHARVVLRGLALAEPSSRDAVSVAATLEGPDGVTPVRLWPSGPPGHFEVVLPAAASMGAHRLTVSASGHEGRAAFLLSDDAVAPHGDERDLVAAWARSRGGAVVSGARLDELESALDRVLQPERRDETWHPMRSAWWIVPFALALGGDWWWRRRTRTTP